MSIFTFGHWDTAGTLFRDTGTLCADVGSCGLQKLKQLLLLREVRLG